MWLWCCSQGAVRGGGLTLPGAGVRTEMSPGKHCENVTATLTAGQFSKREYCWPFPPVCQDKELGLGPAPRGMFQLNKHYEQ